MTNFSYANRVLKGELQALLDALCKGSKRPVSKLFFDLVYGLMRSGSTLVSEIGRALGDGSSINVTENRLTQAMSSADAKNIESALADFALSLSIGFAAVDESDVQKPCGKKFQWLDSVQDGSEEGRPIGKGYHVIGMASIAARNQPIPFVLKAYSTEADGYKSQLKEHEGSCSAKAPGVTISMDRGYDGKGWPKFASDRKMHWVIRAKSSRKYSVPSMKSSKKRIQEIASAVKGRYAFWFDEPGKKDPVEVKATAVRVLHKGLPKSTWAIFEFFPFEAEARCYITDLDCSTKEGCKKALSCYRLRWRVEEVFRFMKVFYAMEGFMVRSLNAMNWVLLAVCAATAFLGSIAAKRTAAYWLCREAFKSFAPDMTDERITKLKGHIPVELYRIAGGAKEILSHSVSKMTPKGRDRTSKGAIQLLLDI